MPSTELNILIEPLGPHHDREAFSCGVKFIDTFLKRKCLDAHELFKVRAYTARRPDNVKVLGYYTLSLTALKPEDTGPDEAHEKFGAWAVPFVYLGLLGVTEEACGEGIGSALMLDAFKRTLVIAQMAGTYGLMLDAINEEKAVWYADRGLIEFGRDDDGRVQMHVPLPTIREALSQGGITISDAEIGNMFGDLVSADAA
jgi:hypothetical protein